MPISNAPMNTYWRRLPQRERVLSEMNPMIGSRMASKARGAKKITPHIQPGKPKS